MKAIRALVRPVMRDQVIDALADLPRHSGIGVSTVMEYGRDPDSGDLAMVEMSRLELEVPADNVEHVCHAIRDAGRTAGGHRGDGKVLVLALDDWSRIED